MAATRSVASIISVCTGVMARSMRWPENSAMASMAGTVRMTVDNEAPRAMFTTDCIRLASAARSAVSISGAADMPATISAISPMGTLMP
ncbi:hypothetical protein G6F64_015015 [Rhizopus arrhizus]|uniref:Uncharacterized protein n=1 Tax=Rhizopus oryzae TaxID=64495 RepID=A0A9P6WSH3_RHIOR|nr:hypothetical protein G6F64_015015 [Rhizopus arrhizus]